MPNANLPPPEIPTDVPHVVVVDDEAIQRKLLRRHLEAAQYRVSDAANAQELYQLLDHQPVDLLLLDVMMPGQDGLSLTRDLRARMQLGIILVTRKDSHEDRILGLDLGADDYIQKPFDPGELLARVRSVLRRVRDQGTALVTQDTQFDGYHLDNTRRLLTTPTGETFKLSRGEYSLLNLLLQHPGQLLSRSALTQAMHPNTDNPNEASRSVDVLIGRLRRKLGDTPRDPRYIVTVHGAGYVFNGKPQ